MNARHQGYQLPPTAELTLKDMAPFIASSLSESSLNSQASNPTTTGNTRLPQIMPPSFLQRQQRGEQDDDESSSRQRLQSIIQDALQLFDTLVDDQDDMDLMFR